MSPNLEFLNQSNDARSDFLLDKVCYDISDELITSAVKIDPEQSSSVNKRLDLLRSDPQYFFIILIS